jgi:hypothetical protein
MRILIRWKKTEQGDTCYHYPSMYIIVGSWMIQFTPFWWVFDKGDGDYWDFGPLGWSRYL